LTRRRLHLLVALLRADGVVQAPQRSELCQRRAQQHRRVPEAHVRAAAAEAAVVGVKQAAAAAATRRGGAATAAPAPAILAASHR
jgi:hypothetical protein